MDLDPIYGDDHHTEAAHAELSRLPYGAPSRPSIADRTPISAIMATHGSSVRERLSVDPIPARAGALRADSSVAAAAAAMAREGVHRLPVVCMQGRPVGVISALDILRWFAEQEGYNAGK
jgi:CBS-domain-containing membrane protein